MKIELQVSLPDGYEATGEYRSVSIGEHYFDKEAKYWAGICTGERSSSQYIILRKKAPAMRPMTEGEALWILTTPRCVIRHIDREEWEVPTIHAEYVQNYVYGFVNEGGAITSVSKFEKEIAE